MNVEFISAALVESTKAPSFHILASIYRHRYTSHVPNMLQDTYKQKTYPKIIFKHINQTFPNPRPTIMRICCYYEIKKTIITKKQSI